MKLSLNQATVKRLTLAEAVDGCVRAGIPAIGLWRERRWGLWLGAVGGAIYVPVEVYELWHRPSPIKAATLALNVAVVAYLGWNLWRREQQAAALARATL